MLLFVYCSVVMQEWGAGGTAAAGAPLGGEGTGDNSMFKNFLYWSLAAKFPEVVFSLEPSLSVSNSVDPLSNIYPNSGTP